MHDMILAETLALRIGTPDAPLILDLCTPEDFTADPRLVPGARRMAHGALSRATLPADWRGRAVVTLCQKGAKLSQGAAARLHAEGCTALALSGGMYGWHAAGLATIRAAALPEAGLWATAPGPEAAFAQWLLARFAPAGQVLMVVEAAQLSGVAERFAARPIVSGAALLAELHLAARSLETLAAACAAPPEHPLAFAALLAKSARDPRAGAPDAPALALLDLALAALRPEGTL